MRNGWWIILFIGLVILTQPIYKPIKQGVGELGFTEQWLEPVSVLLLLLVTWICMKIASTYQSKLACKPISLSGPKCQRI